MVGRKKVKANRIEEAEEGEEDVFQSIVQEEKAVPKSAKKAE